MHGYALAVLAHWKVGFGDKGSTRHVNSCEEKSNIMTNNFFWRQFTLLILVSEYADTCATASQYTDF